MFLRLARAAGGEGQESAWDAWVRPLLVGALGAAPLDLGDLWAVALRYGLYGLLGARDAAAVQSLLAVVASPAQDGAWRCMAPLAPALLDSVTISRFFECSNNALGVTAH